MSAAIVKDDRVLWTKGFGYADVQRRIPATPRTVYYIASLTKTFATTVLMQLVEQGKLDLDDPMSKYSDEFKDDIVKVKHVLSHTADAPPGERFRYDGARFATLTAVIEKKTGKSFRDVMTERFLDPLEMKDSIPSRDTFEVATKNPTLYDKDSFIVTGYLWRATQNRTGSTVMTLYSLRIRGKESAPPPVCSVQLLIWRSS